MQSQTRNWFLFFGLFFALMLGHTWLRNKLWPPPPKLTAEAAAAVDGASRLMAAYTGAGLSDACNLAIQATVNPASAREYLLAVREAKDKVPAVAKAAPPKPVEPDKPQPKPEHISLGGDGYLISLTLTTLGAGVEQLILNPFPEVNR